jgi:nitrite reductase/ring-hydroxylating ferredoxin subunit
LLLGMGVAGVALAAGCGDDGGSSSGSSGSGLASASGPASSGAATGGPATRASGKGAPATPTDPGTIEPLPTGGPPVGALLSTKEVPVGGGVLVGDQLIIVQPKAGTFKAFDARCPHQGFTVQAPFAGSKVMECPGHNSQFRVADGSLARGPATRGLSAVSIKVMDGYIVQV